MVSEFDYEWGLKELELQNFVGFDFSLWLALNALQAFW